MKLNSMRWSLSYKLLSLTIGVIFLVQMLILVPAAMRFRENWLSQHIQTAETTALLLQVITPDDLTSKEWMTVFDSLYVYTISLKRDGKEIFIALNEDIPNYPMSYEDSKSYNNLGDFFDTAKTILYKGDRLILLKNKTILSNGTIEILILERPLFADLLRYIQQVLFSTFIITLCVGLSLYWVLNYLFIIPLKRLNIEMLKFRAKPETYTPVMLYSHHNDEIGELSSNFEVLQLEILAAFKKKDYLATLGLAVAKISHDLRNILTAAQLMSDRMVMQTDAKTRDYLTQLVQTIDRAVELCQSTLIYGKLGSVEINKKPIDLKVLLHEIAHTLDLHAKNINLVVTISEPIHVQADPEYLYRILFNLIRNSMQAMETSSNKIITCNAQMVQNHIEIDLYDTGIGIPTTLQDKLFKPFQTQTQNGTGLGLSIVKELIEAHSGSISCLPSVSGAHFRLILPL